MDSRRTFNLALSFDLLLTVNDASSHKFAFIDAQILQSKSVESIVKTVGLEYNSYLTKMKADGAFSADSNTIGEYMFPNFNLIATEFAFSRIIGIPINESTHFVVERNKQIILAVNFYELVFRRIMNTRNGINVISTKIDVPTHRDTLLLAIDKPELITSLQIKDEVVNSGISAEVKMERLLEMQESIQARIPWIKKMLEISKGTKAISPILQAIVEVGKELLVYDESPQANFGDIQRQIWDSIIQSFLSVLLLHDALPHDNLHIEMPEHTDEEIQIAAVAIHPFTVDDLKIFLKTDYSLLSIFLHQGSLIKWLLVNRINLQPDLDLMIGLPNTRHDLDGLIKIHSINSYWVIVLSGYDKSRLMLLNRLIREYISVEASMKKILSLIRFINSECFSYRDQLALTIHNSPQERIEFFTSIIDLLIKISKSPIEGKIIEISRETVVIGLLNGNSNIIFEFFNQVFQHRILQSVAMLRLFFELEFVSTNEKQALFELLLEECVKGNGGDMNIIISEMIKNRGYFKIRSRQCEFNINNVIGNIDSKLIEITDKEDFIEKVINRNALTEFHTSCIVAYDQMIMLGRNSDTVPKNSRLEKLFRFSKEYISQIPTLVTIGQLLNGKAFSVKIEEMFDALNEDDYSPFHLKLLQLKNKALQISKTLGNALKFLDSNSDLLSDYQFHGIVTEILMKFRQNLQNLKLDGISKRNEYLTCLFFEKSHFVTFRMLVNNYQRYWNDIKTALPLPESTSLNDFDLVLGKKMLEMRNRLEGLGDPKKYRVVEFKEYMDKFEENKEQKEKYDTLFQCLSIDPKIRDRVYASSKIISMFLKIIHLTEPLYNLTNGKIFSLTTNSTMKKMREIKNSVTGQDINNITVKDIDKFDSPGLVRTYNKQNEFVTSLPWVVKEIGSSPELMNFIKTNGDKFIKSMREEVDNDNMEIVNKLDAINRDLKFIFLEKDIDIVVVKLNKLGESELEKLRLYMSGLEGLVRTHITFLADKTKKDAGYSNQLIKHLLSGCEYRFEYQKDTREYGIGAYYRRNEVSINISLTELSELMNKSMIIVSERNNDVSNDEFNNRIIKFNEVSKQLLVIKSLLKHLKDLGVINQDFEKIAWMIKGESRGEGKELIIKYESEGGVAEMQKIISDFQKLIIDYEKILKNSYRMETALLTHYYGKKLYWLAEFLTSKEELSKDKSEQCLNIMLESHPAQGFRNASFEGGRIKDKLLRHPVEKLTYVQKVMKDWSREVVGKREITTKVVDTVFSARKVEYVIGIDNIFDRILRILKDCGNPDVSLSQFLFCTSSTTEEQIQAFIKRTVLDKAQRAHFIIGLDRVSYDSIERVRKEIEEISEEEWAESNNRLMIFIKNTTSSSNISSIIDNDIFLNNSIVVNSLNTTVSDDDVRKMFVKSMNKLEVVVSEVAGMGKTTYIKEKCKGMDIVDVFIAGEVTSTTLKKRLLNASKQIENITGKYCLVIKLDFIEDFHINADLVDYLLFCVCFLNKVNTEYGVFLFGERLWKIYIEVGNTFAADLISHLSILQFIVETKDPSKLNCLHRVGEFKLEDVQFKSEPTSSECTVGKFLLAYQMKMGSLESPGDINKETFHNLLQRHLVDRVLKKGDISSLTFARYQYWLKTISHIVSEMKLAVKCLKKELEKEVFIQIAEEIIDFSTSVIGLSVKHVKTSQDEMKKIMKSIDKDKMREENLEKYQQSVKGLMNSWNTKEMIIPMANSKNFLFALANIELFNEGTHRYGIRNELKRYIVQRGWYINPQELKKTMTEEYLSIICTFVDRKYEDVLNETKTFRGTGFSLTGENYMKICLILFKAALNIPIIMMGESGCGKTYLSHYVAECILGEQMLDLTLYSGVTEEAFITFMREVITAANATPKRVWVLFDEFNTSCLQSIVAEIMIDRVCSIDHSVYNIPSNVVFIACCNPYRMKSKMTNVGLVSRTSNVVLSHRVYPIPERLIDFVWDFGQLTEQDEIHILKGIIRAEKLFDDRDYQTEDNFRMVIYDCHKFVRDLEERSGVSLRDIKRVLNMYRWFNNLLHSIQKFVSHNDLKEEQRIRYWALICALMVCYGLRLNGRDEQVDFLMNLTSRANQLLSMKGYKKGEVHDILPKVADFFFNELKKEGSSIIGEGTAINRPLKENFITMLASFDTVTPMIICGAPGTSKTLSTHILNSTFVPYIMKKYPIFNIFKRGINPIYYGGSETSTSEGISLVFRRGEKYLEQGGEDAPMVVFDEVGLAELSPYNPLKILHPLLEKKDMKVGFVGLSNWTLDLSKMNRLIYISRPDMELNDLIEIFETSLSGNTDSQFNALLKKYLFVLSKSYLKFRMWQKRYGTHPNFHGSRDIYSVAKFFYGALQNIRDKNYQGLEGKLSSLNLQEQTSGLVKIGIERNFGGTVYEFSSNERASFSSDTAIGIETIENLITEGKNAVEQTSEKNKRERLGDIYDLRQKQIGKKDQDDAVTGLQLRKALSNTNSLYFTSAQIFKRLFLNELENTSNKAEHQSFFTGEFLKNHNIFDLIGSSLVDQNCRFMLVRTEGEIVENILIEKIRGLLKDNKIVDWRGVSKRESNLELFSNIKSYISLGYFVIMKNLDELYGSLYDLFNQKFMEVDDRKYCYLYFGESKHRVEVHPNFNCCILIEAEDASNLSDIEITQPAPFLNRFEKYHLKVADVFPGRRLEELLQVREMVRMIANGRTNQAVALNMDMISSICIQCQKDRGQIDVQHHYGADLVDENMDERVSIYDQFPKQARLVFRLTTLNYIMRPQISSQEIGFLKDEHPYTSFGALLRDVKQSGKRKVCVYTFSNPIEMEAMKGGIQEQYKIECIKSDNLYTAGLETRTRTIRGYDKEMMILQIMNMEHVQLITQLKAAMSENIILKQVVIVVHMDKLAHKREILKQSVGLNYWGDWDNYVIDNLRNTEYDKLVDMRDYTLNELVQSNNDMLRTVLHEVLISTYQRIALEKGEGVVKEWLQSIRRSIERDEDDILVDVLKEKLKELNLVDNSKKWMFLVENTKQNNNYIDFERDVYDIIMNLYSDKIKKIVHNINRYIHNYAGYTFGLLSKEEEVVKLYRTKLKAVVTNMHIQLLTTPSSNNKQQKDVLYKVPFLFDSYNDLINEIVSNIFEANKTTLNNINDYSHRVGMMEGKLTKNEEKEKFKDLLRKGEEFIRDKYKSIMMPMLNTMTKQVESKQQIMRFILDDILLLLLSLPRFKIPPALRNTNLMLQLSSVVNKKYRTGKEMVEGVYTAIYLLGAMPDDVRLVLDMIVNSNMSSEKLLGIVNGIVSSSDMYIDVSNLHSLVRLIQYSIIPTINTINITKIRLQVEGMLESIVMEEEKRTGRVVIIDTLLYNGYKCISILLSLIDLLPPGTKESYISEVEKIRSGLEMYSKNIEYDSMKEVIEKIIVDSRLEIKDKQRYDLLLGEYIRLNIVNKDYSFYDSKAFDEIVYPNNRYLDILSSISAYEIARNIPICDSLEKYSSLCDNRSSLENLDKLLERFKVSKKKYIYIIIHIVDYLYMRIITERGGMIDGTKENVKKMLQLVKSKSNNISSFYSVRGIFSALMLRAYITSANVEEINKDGTLSNGIDSELIDIVNSKDEYFVSIHSYLITYYTQRIYRMTGEMGSSNMKSIRIIYDLINSSGDTDLMIVTLDSELNKYINKQNDHLTSIVSKHEIDSLQGVFNKQFKNSATINFYTVGVSLINRFIQLIENDIQERVINSSRSTYLDILSKIKLPTNVRQIYNIILNDQLADVSYLYNITGDIKPKDKIFIKYKKTIYHLLLVMMCYNCTENFFDINALLTNNGIIMDRMQAKISNSENLSNFISVFMNIMRERLSDGSYQDYGANLGRNLGIYQCSCKLVYSIGQCGYAMEKSKCPRCGKEIGGGNHQSVQREGHIHIQNLNDFVKIIFDEMSANEKYYKIHTPLSNNSTELISHCLKTLTLKEFGRLRNQLDAPEILNHQKQLMLSHLVDHLLLYFYKQLVSPSQKESVSTRMDNLVNLKDKTVQELLGKIDGRALTSSADYFIYQIRNDLSQLQLITKCNNLSETLNFINSAISNYSIRASGKGELGEILMINFSDVDDHVKMLKKLEEEKNEQLSVQDEQNKLMKSIIQKKSDVLKVLELVPLDSEGHLKDKRTVASNIYGMLRHVELTKDSIFDTFKTKLDTSPFHFLKNVVNYHYVLDEFPRLVVANLDMALHFNQQYNRVFTFDETTKTDINTLNDPVLIELFKEFKTVWTSVIPKHEDVHPEVFSFAFMCNQDLNVAKYVERVLSPHNASILSFLLVDGTEEFAGKDTLYMKGIIRTFLEGFHNKMIKQAKKVLRAEEELSKSRISLDYLTKDDIITSIDWQSIVLDNTFITADVTQENEINFNYERIEYLVAKKFIRAEVACEENDIRFYNFKNSKVLESEQLVKSLSSKIKLVPLDRDIVNTIQNMSENEVETSLKFITEIGEYISQNFIFNNSELLLSELLKSNKNPNLCKRFAQFETNKHGELKVGQIVEYFTLVKDKNFQNQLNQQKKIYSKAIPQKLKDSLEEELNSVTPDGLNKLKTTINESVKNGFNLKNFSDTVISDQIDIEDIVLIKVPSFKTLTFSNYFMILDLIDALIYEHTKNH